MFLHYLKLASLLHCQHEISAHIGVALLWL